MFWDREPEDPGLRKLTKNTVTQGSKIVLPLYPTLFLVLGVILILQGPERTSGVAYNVARSVMPAHTWGVLFLVVGVAEAWFLWRGSRRAFMNMLTLGSGLCGFWATLFLIAAIQDTHVSWTGAVWLFFAAGCHMASVRSLSRDFVITDDTKT